MRRFPRSACLAALAHLFIHGPVWAQAGMPPIPVTAVPVAAAPWQPVIPAIGFLEAQRGVDVSPAVGGLVVELGFDSGQAVKAGQTLLRLDSAVERTELQVTRAEIPNLLANLERARDLLRSAAGTRQRVDEAQSAYDRAQARIANLTAIIERRSVNAPFDGVLGIRDVDIGQYVQPGQKLVTLQDLSHMRVRFTLPQRDLARIKVGQPLTIRVDAWPGREFAGEISAIEPQVTQASGIVPVQAKIPNAEGLLRPGMFATLDIKLPPQPDIIALPTGAVTFSLYGESVFVIEGAPGAQTAQRRAITTGERRGDQVVIASGLKPGETVISFGQIRIQNGARVQIIPADAQAKPPATAPRY